MLLEHYSTDVDQAHQEHPSHGAEDQILDRCWSTWWFVLFVTRDDHPAGVDDDTVGSSGTAPVSSSTHVVLHDCWIEVSRQPRGTACSPGHHEHEVDGLRSGTAAWAPCAERGELLERAEWHQSSLPGRGDHCLGQTRPVARTALRSPNPRPFGGPGRPGKGPGALSGLRSLVPRASGPNGTRPRRRRTGRAADRPKSAASPQEDLVPLGTRPESEF